jgi:putative transposase
MEKTKRLRFPIEVILVCIRWYAAYPLSYRHIEEMMEEGSVALKTASQNSGRVYIRSQTERISPAKA